MLQNITFECIAPNLILPTRSSPGSAGYDLQAFIPAGVGIPSGKSYTFKTGVKVKIPSGHVGLIRGRSGMAFKNLILTYEGTIDSDYRGEIKVFLYNIGSNTYYVQCGHKIAQLIVVPCLYTKGDFVNRVRGNQGFGSSGL